MFKIKLFLTMFLVKAAICLATVQEGEDACIGKTICSSSECFTIIKKLGEGGFSQVYKVKNREGKIFALKSFKLPEDDSFSSSISGSGGLWINLLAKPEREFEMGQILDHPHIIKSFDLFSAKTACGLDSNHLLLQMVKGKTLGEISEGALSREEGVNVAFQFCEALRYALSFDLMYLDFNLGNVMVSQNKEIMIIDLASFVSSDELLSLAKIEKQQINSINPSITTLHPTQLSQANVPQKTFLHFGYFRVITNTCFQILERADLTHEEKLQIRAQVKKIRKGFKQDIGASKIVPIDVYFDQLTTVIRSF